MMQLLDLTSYRITNFSFEPHQIRLKSFNVRLFYDHKPFKIQSPVCTIENIVYDDKTKAPKMLLVSFLVADYFSYLMFFGSIDTVILKYIQTFVSKQNIMSSKDATTKYNPGSYELNSCTEDNENDESAASDGESAASAAENDEEENDDESAASDDESAEREIVSDEQDSKTKYIIQLKVDNNTKYFNRQKQKIPFTIKKNDKVIFLFYTKGIFLDEHAINFRWTAEQVLSIK